VAATRLIVGGTAAVLTAAVLLFGGILSRSSGSAPAGADAVPVAARVDVASDPQLLPRLQEQVRAHPKDVHGLGLLGLAYEQRARDTGDSGYYPKAEGVLKRALRLAPDDLIATSALGGLALSRHKFRDALALGRRTVALSPSTARGYGVVGDALVELGRYEQAFEAFNTMVSLKPSVSSYARISYARELLGDVPGAASAMRLAVESAVGQSESLAWSHTQLGKVYWGHGRIRPAERHARAALAVQPGYVYALDLLAQVEAARGRFGRAVAFEQRAVDAIPLPQFVGLLGDLHAAAGDGAAAARQYALIGAIERLFRANGVKVDLESALFDVDHGIRLSDALGRAREARAARPSIDGDDVLAWALARSGRCAEARVYSVRALRLGTQDATKFFHRGMIERCLGRTAEAKRWFHRALTVNANFSVLWAPVARRYAA
jgi:tetratricopeptide (TPR) repeat protein